MKKQTLFRGALCAAVSVCVLVTLSQNRSVQSGSSHTVTRLNQALGQFHPAHLVPSSLPEPEEAVTASSAPGAKPAAPASAPAQPASASSAVQTAPHISLSSESSPALAPPQQQPLPAQQPAQPASEQSVRKDAPAPAAVAAPSQEPADIRVASPTITPPDAEPSPETAEVKAVSSAAGGGTPWAWSPEKEACLQLGSLDSELNCLIKSTIEREVLPQHRKIAFLKTHKTGSTTFASVLHRYSVRHCLRLYDAPWRGQHYYSGASHGTEVDVFNRHVKPNFFSLHSSLKKLLRVDKPGSTWFFVTIFREPVDQWVSAFNYYTWPRVHMDIDKHVTTGGAVQNPLSSWDLQVRNEADKQRFIKEGLPLLDCIVLTHKWAEGMTMMGERLGWEAIDTTYWEMFKNKEGARNFANAPVGQFKTKNLTAATRERIEKLVRLDLGIWAEVVKAYEKQVADFKARIGEEEFARRVAETERVQALVKRQCEEHAGSQACFWHRQSDINLEHDANQGYPMSAKRDSQYFLGGKDEPGQDVSPALYPMGCEARKRREASELPSALSSAALRGVGAASSLASSLAQRGNLSACDRSSFFVGVDLKGGDVGAAKRAGSAEECCRVCQQVQGCKLFTYAQGMCWVKDRVGSIQVDSGMVSGAAVEGAGSATLAAAAQGQGGEGAGGSSVQAAAPVTAAERASRALADGEHRFSAVLLTRIGFSEDRMRQEFRELREWLEFMLYAGVDHIYVYDNWRRPEEAVSECLQPYVRRGLITYHDWNLNGATYQVCQTKAYQHFLQHYKQKTEFAITVDMDEYPIVWSDQEPGYLLRFVQQRIVKNCHIYFQCQLWVGPDPLEKKPGVLFMERYNNSLPTVPYPDRAKTIYRTAVTTSVVVHSVTLDGSKAGALGCNSKHVVPEEEGSLVHFWGHRQWGNGKQPLRARADQRMAHFAAKMKALHNLSSPASEFQGRCASTL